MVWGVSEKLCTTILIDFGQNVLDTIWHGVHQQQLFAEKFTQLLNVTRIRNIYWFCYNEIAIIYVSLERLLFKCLGQNSDRYHLYPLCISFCLGVFFNFSGLNFIREADSSGIPKPSGFSGRKNSLIRLDIAKRNMGKPHYGNKYFSPLVYFITIPLRNGIAPWQTPLPKCEKWVR